MSVITAAIVGASLLALIPLGWFGAEVRNAWYHRSRPAPSVVFASAGLLLADAGILCLILALNKHGGPSAMLFAGMTGGYIGAGVGLLVAAFAAHTIEFESRPHDL